jgi:NAD(P)-dependent dehydrogenase (short-subunit alcohol dehydrogenase family)
MAGRFRGKVVLITGAGGGIGEAVTRLFAKQGDAIVATDRDEACMARARSISPESSAVELITGDLSNPEFCDRLPALARDVHGQLDIMVNNAGIMRRGNILDTSDEDWSVTMAVNVESVFRTCRSAIPIMKSVGKGAIVNVASCWGIYPGPDHVAYCTSKAAVAAMTRCLGRDHAGDGIRINAVCPNEVNTPMLRTGFEIRGLDPGSAIETLNQTVPIGRIAEPEEIADTICWLASEEARYVCGVLLEVNGAKPVY